MRFSYPSECPACGSKRTLIDRGGPFECESCGWLRPDQSVDFTVSLPAELLRKVNAARGPYSVKEWILAAIEEKI